MGTDMVQVDKERLREERIARLRSADRSSRAELKERSEVCLCTGCGLYFTGVQPFEKHLADTGTANPVCKGVAQMLAEGMKQNNHGVWQTGITKEKAEKSVG